MDINLLRGIATVLVMTAFIGMVIWVYFYRGKQHFDEAANLPFDEDHSTGSQP